MSNDCDHYLYVMAKWEGKDPTSPVKIGISASPESRLLSIQTACPFPVRMICHLTAPSREIALAVEKCFHHTQKKHRLYGEWFDINPLHAVQLVVLAYRTMVEARVSSKDLHQDIFEVSGVTEVQNWIDSLLK